MAKVNMLLKKGYLLAGVIMAANIFVVNEMKASTISSEENNGDNTEKKEEINGGEGKEEKKSNVQGFFNFVLTYENTINFFGGALFTLANSFYKFYENKPGFYFDYYFAGWNSNPFVKGYLQFCPNINLGRGILWLIPGAYNFIKGINSEEKEEDAEDYLKPLYVSFLVAERFKNDTACATALIVVFLLQGFVSMPLTLHLSNFSISISLDSMIWAVIGYILDKKYGEIPVKGDEKESSIDTNQINEEKNDFLNENEENNKIK